MTAPRADASGRIVVIGGLNMDLHLFGVHRYVGQAPLVADRYIAEPGGKGANVARAAARLGAEVALVGRVGDDEFGRQCEAAVAADGVDTSRVLVTPGASTGFVAIELTEGRHGSLLFAPGANALLTWSDVEPGLDGLGPGDLVIVQAEVPPAVLDEMAVMVARERFTLFLDPTPPDQVRRAHLAAADVITPNLVEASQLVGRVDTSLLWPALAAVELMTSGARRVVIKAGASGAVFADEDGLVEVPTLRVDIVDETGAGDAFLAALAVRISEGADWADAVAYANVASAISVATHGLTLPDRRAIDAALGRVDAPMVRIPFPS